MRKYTALTLAILLALLLSACGLTADHEKTKETATRVEEPTEMPTQPSSEEPTATPEPEPVKVDPFTQGHIAYYKYEWGTSLEEIKSKEIKPWMVEGRNYGYYDSGLQYFEKELVVDDEIQGVYFVTRLDFDRNDQLVSAMPVLEESLTDRARIQIYLDMVAQCKELYGEPERYVGLPVDENTDVDQFTQSVIDGKSCSYIWSDADRNQLIVDCHKGQDRVDVVVIFNTKDYRL